MFGITAEWVVKRLEMNNIISQDRSIYKYGIELLISSVVGRSMVLLVGILLNQFVFAVMFILMFITTRGNFGGYHCKSYAKCISSYLILYLVSLFVIINSNISQSFIMLMLLLYNGIVLICCPVRNIKKQLSENEYKIHRIKAIIKSVLISILIIALYSHNQSISKYIFIVFTIIIILVIGGKIEYEKVKG